MEPPAPTLCYIPAMRAVPFFFAYFWFSPLTGGWRSKRA